MTEFPEVPQVMPGFTGLPVRTESPTQGPSHGTVEWLLEAIERHAAAEADALDQYRSVATASQDPVIALVMQLILEDEERHHGLLKRMEATLRDALQWTRSPNALPSTAAQQVPAAKDLAGSVRTLIDEERTGASYMRQLARQEEGMNAGLDSLLFEMMALDSEKHAKLLEFVRDRLLSRSRDGG